MEFRMMAVLLSLSVALASPEGGDEEPRSWRTEGHLLLGAGILLGVASLVSFNAGFEAERVLQSQRHDRAAADALMLRRGVAAGFAWPMLVLSAASSAGGVTLLALEELPR
jgi:hypothetical protein